MEPGSTASDLIVRYLGTQSELRQRIGAGLTTLLNGLVEQGLELPKIHWIET
jgi:hypothetical protein